MYAKKSSVLTYANKSVVSVPVSYTHLTLPTIA